MADGLLKICGEPIVPGLALPKAFEMLEKHIETATNLCKLKGTQESQVAGLLIVCGELQRLLRLAFVENGILASRIEMLACYQDDFIRRCEKKIRGFNVEQRVSRRYLKKLRHRQLRYETVRRKKDDKRWAVEVASSDYDTVSSLSRMSGNPNLEFMLRINQLLLDFVKDSNSMELSLPPMGSEERSELSKLASLYKLRCRFNKLTQIASSTIIKARQTCIPADGEIDNLLNSFTKKIKDGGDMIISDAGSPKSDLEKEDASAVTNTSVSSGKDALIAPSPQASSAPPIEHASQSLPTTSDNPIDITKEENILPSYMLTPVSSIGTPTITLEGGGEPALQLSQHKETRANSEKEGGMSENPLPSLPSHTPPINPSRPSSTGNPSAMGITPTSGSAAAAQALLKLLPDSFEQTSSVTRGSSSGNVTHHPTTPNKSQSNISGSLPAQLATLYPSSSTTSLASPSAIQMALLMQSHQQLRALSAAAAAVSGGQGSSTPVTPPSSGRSTVLASPLSLSLSGSNKSGSGLKRDGEGLGSGGGVCKKTKVTRRSYTDRK